LRSLLKTDGRRLDLIVESLCDKRNLSDEIMELRGNGLLLFINLQEGEDKTWIEELFLKPQL
jgi:hypothetical protein